MSRGKPLEIGIVGLGTRGQSLAETFDAMGQEFVGTEINEQVAAEFEDRFGVETYETPEEMYDAGVDAVAIATPNKFHESAAVGALERDLDVLIEKPLAHTTESAAGIRGAAQESRGQCFVGFYHRFSDMTAILRAYIDEGRLGEVTHIEARYVRRRGIPSFGSWRTSNAIAGGGALIDIGVHVIDLVLHLYGFPDVEDILGTTRREFGNHDEYTSYLNMWGNEPQSRMFDVEDSASAFVTFEDGRTASMEVAWAANCREEEAHKYRVRGDQSGAELSIRPDTEDDLALFETSVSGTPHFIDKDIETDESDLTRNQLEAFVQAVRTGDVGNLATSSEAMQTQRIVKAIYDQ